MANGKNLEAKIGRSLERMGGWEHNNNHFPACDWQFTQDGRTHLIECKELESDAFPLKRITPNERKALTRCTWAGGLAVIVIERLDRYGPLACWGWDWLDWLGHEQQIGYEPVILYPLNDTPRPRRKPGSAEIKIDDNSKRPSFAVSLTLSQCRRRYDLEPWLSSLRNKPGRFEGLQALRERYESGLPIFEGVTR